MPGLNKLNGVCMHGSCEASAAATHQHMQRGEGCSCCLRKYMLVAERA